MNTAGTSPISTAGQRHAGASAAPEDDGPEGLVELGRRADQLVEEFAAATDDEAPGILEELIHLIEKILAAILDVPLGRTSAEAPPEFLRICARDLANRAAHNRRAVRAGRRPTIVGFGQEAPMNSTPTRASFADIAGLARNAVERIERAETTHGRAVPAENVIPTLINHDGLDRDTAERVAAAVGRIRYARATQASVEFIRTWNRAMYTRDIGQHAAAGRADDELER